jgi:PleD family two-component response regulator
VVQAGQRLKQMSRRGAYSRYVVSGLALLSLVALAAPSVALKSHSLRNKGLQELADTAALAGVNSLVATNNQTDEARIHASVSAAHKVLSIKPDVVTTVSPSIHQLSVAVLLKDTSNSRISAVAYYIPPSPELLLKRAASSASALSPAVDPAQRL